MSRLEREERMAANDSAKPRKVMNHFYDSLTTILPRSEEEADYKRTFFHLVLGWNTRARKLPVSGVNCSRVTSLDADNYTPSPSHFSLQQTIIFFLSNFRTIFSKCIFSNNSFFLFVFLKIFLKIFPSNNIYIYIYIYTRFSRSCGEKTRVVSRRGGRVWRGEADCAFQRLASIPDRRSRRSSPVGRRKTLNQRFLGWAVVSSLSLSRSTVSTVNLGE